MMPNPSVNPAARKNSSGPNCNPFRNCSTMSSIELAQVKETAAARKRRRHIRQASRLLHRAFVVEGVLAVLDNGRHGFQHELALGVLDHVLQIKILNRDVVVAVFE